MGGIFVDFSVNNQLNSPALNSNTFANRPAAGQIGRLFISTDTFEIYRDNGTTWDLIGGPGSSTITGTGTAGNFPIFTSSQVIGNSEMYYTEGSNFNNINFGYTGPGAKYATTELYLYSNDQSRIFLQFGSNKYAQLTNEFGNVYFGANNSGIHGYNDIFFYNGSSAADRYLAFQTEGLDRLTIEQNGDVQLNKYTTNGFLRTSGANGTLSIDTNTYVTNNIYTADGTLAGARTVNLNNHNLRFEGGANVARLRISANNNIARILNFATADVARWSFRVDQNETGGNTGSDFRLNRYADNGSLIDAPIIINRASGHVGIGGGLQQLETFNVTGSSLFSHTYTQGNDFNRKGIFAFLNTTTNSGAGFTNGYNYNAVTGLHWDNFTANTTIPNGVTIGGTYSGAQVGFNTINTTVTLAQGSGGGLRTFSGSIAQIALAAPTTGGVVTHASGFQTLAPFYVGPNLPTITNYFGVAINDSTEYSSVAITNRWGIYQTGATDRNYLNGNVLIGSATDNGNKLQVTGNGNITGNVAIGTTTTFSNPLTTSIGAGAAGSLNNQLSMTHNGATTAYHIKTIRAAASDEPAGLAFIENVTERMRITSGGNVGIGTPTPSDRLTVRSNGTFQSSHPIVRWQNDGLSGDGTLIDGALGYDWNGSSFNAFTGTITNHAFAIRTNNTERMRISSAGNVGIGTSSPSELLHLYGTGISPRPALFIETTNASATPELRLFQTSGRSVLMNLQTNGDWSFQNSANNSSYNTRMTITSGGNTLIGTTTDAGQKLQVNGEILMSNNGSPRLVLQDTDTGAGNVGIKFRENTTDTWSFASASGNLQFFSETNSATRFWIKATGQARFVPLAADPGGAEAGDVYYNSSTNKLRVYNGTSWIDLH